LEIIMRNFALLASMCALSACAAPRMEIVQPPVSAGVIQGVSSQRIADAKQVTVRTLTVQEGETVEVSGLSCEMRSDEVYANFTSPAYVNVPRFVQSARFDNRGRPTPLLIRCEGDGLTGVVSVDGEDKQIGTATNAGIGGAILTTLVTAAVASSTPWKFPDQVNVTVE
jgi:hypothetical protein